MNAYTKTEESPGGRTHIQALDGVRGLAIAGVLFAHSWPDLTGWWRWSGFLNQLAAAGAFGVDLFFVLSGFLITGILLDSAASPNYFRNFYARRILRLFPVYYGYLLLVMIVIPWIHRTLHVSMPDYSGNWWWYLTYFSNWKANFAASDPQLGHFWSLAVEEQFYIVWPTILLLVGSRRLLYVCAALILSATLLRYVWSIQGVAWNQIYRLTVTRWDTIAMGAAAALAVRNSSGSLTKRAGLLAVGGLGVFLAVVWWSGGPEWFRPSIQTFGSTSASVGFTGVVLYAATARSGVLYGLLRQPLLMSLGKYSYFIYVTHLLFITHFYWLGAFVLRKVPGWDGPASQIILFAVANTSIFLIAGLSWRYFESPILRFKRYFDNAGRTRKISPEASVQATSTGSSLP